MKLSDFFSKLFLQNFISICNEALCVKTKQIVQNFNRLLLLLSIYLYTYILYGYIIYSKYELLFKAVLRKVEKFLLQLLNFEY